MSNLSGFWVGQYAYNGLDVQSVDFDAEMTHIGRTLSGVITEPNSFKELGYIIANILLSANLTGEVKGATLNFTKVYQGKDVPQDPVIYQGQLAKDENTVTGTWNIKSITGTFEMHRDGPAIGVKAELAKASKELNLEPVPTK